MLGNDQAIGFWFLNNHVTFPVAKADNADGFSVMRVMSPFGEAPPMHVYRHKDEIFHIVEGELRFMIGERTLIASKGETLLAPQGVPHGYRVISREGAEFLVVTRGDFENMVRSVARPAQTAMLPQPVAPTAALQAELVARCAANGIDVLGPPIA